MMVERLKHEGTLHNSSDLCEDGGLQAGDTPSGPGAFLLLFFLKTWCTSSSLI